MPLPSQDIHKAILNHDPAAIASLGRVLDSLVVIAGPQTAQLARGSGSAVLTSIQVIAGDGLTGGGALSVDRTLNVGAGAGITVTANAVAVDSTVARSTWPVTAGAGLTGGGNLASAGITLAVGAGTGISVAADAVAVDQSTAFNWTGAQTWAAAATFNDPASFTDTAAFSGGIASSLIPSATDTYDLGSSTKLWRKGWLSELDAVLFAQNVVSVIGGWLMVSKGEGALEADLGSGAGDTTALLGTTANISAHATTGDIILFRGNGAVEYMKVTASGGGGSYTVTRDLDGSGRNAWPAGSVFVNLGYNGTGRIELNASDTPRIQILRQGTTYNAQTEMVRIGDLNGWGGFVAEQYGWAVGDYAGGNYAYYGASSGFKVVSADGNITLDEDGLTILAPAAYASTNAVTWKSAVGGTLYSRLSSYKSGSLNQVSMTAEAVTGVTSSALVSALGATGQEVVAGSVINHFTGSTVALHAYADAAGTPYARAIINGTTVFQATATQIQAAVTGSTGGLLVGGDAQWYRNAADVWRTPDSVRVDVGLNVGTPATASTGDIRTSGGLYSGRDADPGDGNVAYAGALKSYKNSTEYTGYAFVPLTAQLTSTSWDGDAYSDTAKTLIDLSAVFSAPAGIKAVLLYVACRDSGSAANDTYLILGPTNTSLVGMACTPGEVNDRYGRFTVVVPCDSNGDIYYQIEASGAGTFDVIMQIFGYWI